MELNFALSLRQVNFTKISHTIEPIETVESSLVYNLAQAVHYNKITEQKLKDSAYKEQKKQLLLAIKKKKALLANIENDLKKALKIRESEKNVELIRANLYAFKKGMKSLVLTDYSLDPPEEKIIEISDLLSPAEYVEQQFKKIKKAKRGISHIEPRKTQILSELEVLENNLAGLEKNGPKELNIESPSPAKKKKLKDQKRLPYRVFNSTNDILIYVGKSAKDNDDLSLHYAQGNDWWFHVRTGAGSHVVVKSQANALPEQTLVEAAMLAAHFSALRDEPTPEIIYTRAKYIKKPKGLPPGKVIVSQEKSILVRIDILKLAELLQQNKS